MGDKHYVGILLILLVGHNVVCVNSTTNGTLFDIAFEAASSALPGTTHDVSPPPPQGQCVWYGECHYNPTTNTKQNCAYNGPPKYLNNSDAEDFIKNTCFDLLQNGSVPALCCDANQVKTLQTSLTLPEQLLARCPACLRNFAQLWCQSTCSPVQTTFMDVIAIQSDPSQPNVTWVTEVNYFVTYDYANGLYDSCKSVLNPTTNQPALSMLCGMDASQCTAESWLQFMGTTSINPWAPFNIDFYEYNQSEIVYPQNNVTYYPMNATMVSCNDYTPEGNLPCSCQDCVSSCAPNGLPYPEQNTAKCMVGNMECLVFVSILAFVGLLFVLILMAVLHYLISSSGSATIKCADQQKSGAYHHPSSVNLINDGDITRCETIGAWMEAKLESAFCMWGKLCTKHPVIVFLFGLTVSIVCSVGIYYLQVTTDPVALWSAPSSEARQQMDFFDKTFGPFYRTEQLIIVPKNQNFFMSTDPATGIDYYYGPVFSKQFLHEIFNLQADIEALVGVYNGSNVTLQDICVSPLSPDNNNCLVQSIAGWFQDNSSLLDYQHGYDVDLGGGDYLWIEDSDYLSHIRSCALGPTQPADTTPAHMSCLAPYGGPVFPYVILGNFTNNINSTSANYTSATALVLTFLVTNHDIESQNGPAEAWELEFINFMKNYKNINMSIAFSAERSIQDEINRESQSDIATILVSYLVMFVYIAFALGQYNIYSNNLAYFLIQSKILLGLVGVLIVLLSVTASIGVYAFAGIPATLIIVEVVPFLVLAVGVDNIFILVQTYQRDTYRKHELLEDRIGRISGEVIPSMLLSSLSECFCFFLGALSSMPAVKTFSLYAGMAIFFDFFLQITCFLALFTLDIRRQEAGRLEVCCCVRLSPKQSSDEGFLYSLVRDYYTPFVLWKPIRYVVVVVFLAWLCSSIAVLNKIDVGLDQALAMPEDSYVLTYFNYMSMYLSVGAPVYFILKGNFDYSQPANQNYICGSSGCNEDSLCGQIDMAAVWSNRSYIAQPVSSWLDDYFDWLRPGGNPPCCRLYPDESFCSASVVNSTCQSCNVTYSTGRPLPPYFYPYLPDYLKDNPGTQCAKGGHAAYGDALYFASNTSVTSSYFMTYHTVLKTSQDYTNALRNARSISQNITKTINMPGVEVFPYSVFYVYYEQYLTVVGDAVVQLILSVGAIFLVATLLLGMDVWSALMIVLTIVLIVVNLMGLMYWWSISFNAVSLVNLVMAVGISVEFCAHIVRAFSVSTLPTRMDRAKESLSTMGSSVLSGITLTKFGGIIVLGFSHSQIFQVFYFRMYLGIVLFGAAHGLIFLPVLLSFAGPSLNKEKLLRRQRHDSLLARHQQSSGESLNQQCDNDAVSTPIVRSTHQNSV